MDPRIEKKITDDGTIDDDYTFGRPVATYVSTLQQFRLLLLKSRVVLNGPVDELRPRGQLFKPC